MTRGWRGGAALAAIGALALLTFLARAQPIGAAFPGSNGKIAFVTDRDGNDEIYTMNREGGGQENVSDFAGAHETQPAWRATGGEFLFTRTLGGETGIWISNAIGSTVLQVEPLGPGGKVSSPGWSPAGLIVFEAPTSDGDFEIFALNAQGKAQRLTQNPASDRAPVWSPDGRRIAFWSARDRNRNIYVMNADGTNQQRLTDHGDSDRDPEWSPDGAWIAFESARDGNDEIYVMDARMGDQGRATNVTKHTADDKQPAWSADGKKLAFVSDRDGNEEIYVVDLAQPAGPPTAGGVARRLTFNTASDTQPDWQPVGGTEVGTPQTPSGGFTTPAVAAAVTVSTALATAVAVLACTVGAKLVVPCALAWAILVEGGTVVAITNANRQQRELKSLAFPRAGAADSRFQQVAMPRVFAAPGPTNAACGILPSTAGCDELKRTLRSLQGADAFVAQMLEGAAATATRFRAAQRARSTQGQALQRAAAKVYWGVLSYRMKLRQAAAQRFAEVLGRRRATVTATAEQAQQALADLGQLPGVPAWIVARVRRGGLSSTDIAQATAAAKAAAPAGALDLRGQLTKRIDTRALDRAYASLTVAEVALIVDAYTRAKILPARLAAQLRGHLRAAGSAASRRRAMRAFVATVDRSFKRQPQAAFLRIAALPAAGML